MFRYRRLLEADHPRDRTSPARADQSIRGGIGLLLSLPMLMGLVFFAFLSLMGSGINSFGVSAVSELHGTTLVDAGKVVSAYLFAASAGVLLGGYAADRMKRFELIPVTAFSVVAFVLGFVAWATPGMTATTLLFGIAGLCAGTAGPSRDLLIRVITPTGQTGKAFGFVSMGLNAGGIAGPAIFGYLLDHGEPVSVFWATAVFALLAVGSTMALGRVRYRLASSSTPYTAVESA